MSVLPFRKKEAGPPEQMAAADTATIWRQSMGAAAKAFAKGDTKTGIAKVVYASWLAATSPMELDRATATNACSQVNQAAGTFRPDGAA